MTEHFEASSKKHEAVTMLCLANRVGLGLRPLVGAARALSSSLDATQPALQEQIDSAPALIFSKTTCGFCARAKMCFDAVRDAGELDGFEGPAVFELNELPNGAEIQGALTEMTGQRTVPYVFVRSQFIGGGTETMQALESGELLRLLQAE